MIHLISKDGFIKKINGRVLKFQMTELKDLKGCPKGPFHSTFFFYIQADMNYLTNCVFVNEAGFNINMRGTTAHSAKGTPAVNKTRRNAFF